MASNKSTSRPGTGYVPGSHAIESYGSGGFRFAGLSHQGSVIALPTGIQSWGANSAKGIDVSSLTAVIAEMAVIDILLIGCGEKALPPDAPVITALRNIGLNVEVMDTAAAARTYNLMLAEGRRVGAALIAVG